MGDDDAEVRYQRWVDVFPWLGGMPSSGSAGRFGWDTSIAAAEPRERSWRLATISTLAMERLTRWTIGQIFPGLPADIDVLALDIPTRASTAILRSGCAEPADLLALTLEEMLDWRQVGGSTVDSILRALADASTSTEAPRTAALNQVVPVVTDSWVFSTIEDLKRLATWYTALGFPNQPVLGFSIAPGTADEIVAARGRLESLSACEVLGDQSNDLDAAGLLDNAVSQLDSRAAEVLSGRLFAEDPSTLEQLGQSFDLTRERVRQIEARARGSMMSLVSQDGPLMQVATAARELVGVVRPLEDLIQRIPALGREVKSVGQPAWRVIDRLDDAYEIEDGWCVAPTMTAAQSLTQTQLEERADDHGVVRMSALNFVESSDPSQKFETTASWLRYCGYVISGEFVLIRTASVGDYAAAVLSLEGSPLSSQEIIDRFVFERSARSLASAMGADDRFERVDRDRWALKEWGLDAYTGIRSLIRELVGRGGGSARLEDVVEYITSRYSVNGNSVIAYASASPFKTENGIVRLGGERSTRKSAQQTRHLFRRPDGWAYRIRVTKDHLRGSSSVAPMAITTILDLREGQTVQLDSPLGPQSVAWTGIQPSFGTIRRFLMEADVAAGADAFLVVGNDGRFEFEQAREFVGDPLVDAISLVGRGPISDPDMARVALAAAIGLSEDSPVSSIIGEYRARGDEDVADLVLEARERLGSGGPRASNSADSSDVDEVLDLL